MHWFLDPIKNHYADFDGRATRRQYWMFMLIYLIIYFVLAAIGVAIDVPLLVTLFSLVIFVPSIALTARRLHDIGRSGWWQLISFVPLIGFIVMIVFLVTGSKEDNQYGTKPGGSVPDTDATPEAPVAPATQEGGGQQQQQQ